MMVNLFIRFPYVYLMRKTFSSLCLKVWINLLCSFLKIQILNKNREQSKNKLGLNSFFWKISTVSTILGSESTPGS